MIGIGRRSRVISLLALVSVASMAGAQPTAPKRLRPGTSTLAGTVTDAGTKLPLEGCSVRAGFGTESGVTTTNAGGNYEFAGIAEGDYLISADCPGHMFACTTAGDIDDRPCSIVTLLKDQSRRNINFVASVGSTVRGRVIDSAGRPVARANVRLGSRIFGGGVLPLIGRTRATTKSDGSFELANIPPGSWRIEAELPIASGGVRSNIVFYPGVLEGHDAEAVEIVDGKNTDGVIITVPSILDRTLTVRVPPADATMSDLVVTLIRATPLMTRRLEVDTDGTATVTGLIDGHYFVTVTATSGQQRWADYQAVDFFDQPADISLQPQPAGRIRGRITGARGLPSLAGATVGAAWIDGGVTLNPAAPDEVAIAADGSFEIDGIFGRRVLQLGQFEPGWEIESVLLGRSDVKDSGIEVTPASIANVTIVVRPR